MNNGTVQSTSDYSRLHLSALPPDEIGTCIKVHCVLKWGAPIKHALKMNATCQY